jgi:NADH-quinone oxidoreductase subunit E
MALIWAILLGVVVAVVLAVVFQKLVCTDYSRDDNGITRHDVVRGLRNFTGVTGYKAPPDQAGAMEVAKGGAAKSAKASEKPAETSKATPKSAAADGGDAAVKSGTVLDGEKELAERKGEWRYEGDTGASAANVDADIGVKPPGLSAPRGGQPDDLKQIKGVGPKLEQACHDLGYYHFDQLAAWGPDEVARVDENLVGFKGRVSRDDWVDQAKILASGKDTEFSKRTTKDDAH